MENEETRITTGIKDMSLLLNKPYVSYVFKKTQRIFQALYLITDSFDPAEPLRNSFRFNANLLLGNATSFLKNDQKDKHSTAVHIIGTYLETLTLVETAQAIGLMSERNSVILKDEITRLIDVVESNRERVIQLGAEYMEVGNLEDYKRQSVLYKGQENVLNIKDIKKPFVETFFSKVVSPRPQVIPQESKTENKNQRLDKILSLFKTGEELMIKDISAHLKDVSEKTVQRELLLLVATGKLRKKGERRWSTYSLK